MPLARTALRLHLHARLGLLAPIALSLACSTAISGTDAVALGYGPPGDASSGYDGDPVPRARVTGWTPPPRESQGNTLSRTQPEREQAPVEAVAHIEEVLEVCARRAALGDETPQPSCLQSYRIARLFRGLDKWKAFIACVDTAKDLPGADACSAAFPSAFPLEGEPTRERRSCLHVFALSMVEGMGPEPMFSTADLIGFEPLVADCIDTLVDEDRDELGPKRYFEVLDCIDAAETTLEVERCEAAD